MELYSAPSIRLHSVNRDVVPLPFVLMETCGNEFCCVFETEGGSRDSIQTRCWVFILYQSSCRCMHFQLFPPRLPTVIIFSSLALGLDTWSRVGLSVCRSNSRAVVVPQNQFGVLVVVNDG